MTLVHFGAILFPFGPNWTSNVKFSPITTSTSNKYVHTWTLGAHPSLKWSRSAPSPGSRGAQLHPCSHLHGAPHTQSQYVPTRSHFPNPHGLSLYFTILMPSDWTTEFPPTPFLSQFRCFISSGEANKNVLFPCTNHLNRAQALCPTTSFLASLRCSCLNT